MHLVASYWCRMMPTLTSHIPVPQPSYTQARENLVKAIPPKILCLLACGGKDCRYEGPECWKANQQVIRGLFSSWWDTVSVNTTALHQRTAHTLLPLRVTDDIVAMARPSNHLIEKYRIVEQFQRLSVFIAAAAFRRLMSNCSHGWHFIFCLQAEHQISHQHAASRRTRSLWTQPGPRKWFHLLPTHLHGQWQWDLLLYPPVVFNQNHVKSAFTYIPGYGNLGIITHIRGCAYLCIFSIFLQLWDARLWSVVPRWHHRWGESFGLCSDRREGGRPLSCWSGQDRYCGLFASGAQMLSCDFSMCVVFAWQASWSPVTWSTLSASAPARPSTMFGSNGLAPSRPGRRSTRCSALLACSARSWSSTRTWACGMEPHLPCSTTWIDRRCCCTAGRDAHSDTRQRSRRDTIALFPRTQLTGLLNALSWLPGGVPPLCADLLPGPGASFSSRGQCRAGEEVSSEGSEQDGEGDPGGQTLLAPAKWKQQELLGGVSDLLGWPHGVSGEEERAVSRQAQLQWLWPQQAQNPRGLIFTLSLWACKPKTRPEWDRLPILFSIEGRWVESL